MPDRNWQLHLQLLSLNSVAHEEDRLLDTDYYALATETIALSEFQPQPCSMVPPASHHQASLLTGPIRFLHMRRRQYRCPSATNLTPRTPIAASPRRSLMTRAFQSAAFLLAWLITLKFHAQEATTPNSHARPPPCRRHG